MVGNFGVAIMLLTLIIRAAMYPVAQRQFRSMAQMRLVQPKMKALQERHKDDKPKMQQELMKLYKDEKINPLAGCLPTSTDERRVGKECVSRGRTRWSPSH